MNRRWIGPLITAAILGGIALILLANLEPSHSRTSGSPPPPVAGGQAKGSAVPVAGFREYPIGDSVERDGMRIAAVWLPSVEVEGAQVVTGSDLIHLEADIHANEGNPNGFAKDEFVPYLKIRYQVVPKAGGAAVAAGDLYPMVAKDGLHYGANISMPLAGAYRLLYRIEPPSKGGLGRHHDPITGVAPWWDPFEVEFEWDYEGPPRASS